MLQMQEDMGLAQFQNQLLNFHRRDPR
jgi:hypothetical protein